MAQYIVGSINKPHAAWSISPKPVIHNSREAAVLEAKRLATGNTDKNFIVLKVEGVAKRVEVEFQEL